MDFLYKHMKCPLSFLVLHFTMIEVGKMNLVVSDRSCGVIKNIYIYIYVYMFNYILQFTDYSSTEYCESFPKMDQSSS